MYNFKKFETARFGIFNITGDEYSSKGWVLKPTEFKIIGETDDVFVTRLVNSGLKEWEGDYVVERKYILPIGINKSRLVKWVSGQLSIFD